MFLFIEAEIKGDTTPVNRALIEPVILLGGISEKPLAFIGHKRFHISNGMSTDISFVYATLLLGTDSISDLSLISFSISNSFLLCTFLKWLLK